MAMAEERLQKIISQAGIASRRAAEKMILEGRVRVDGKVVRELGTKVNPAAYTISVDGRPLKGEEQHVYLLLNKPKGYLSTAKDDRGRCTVLDLLPEVKERVYPVGRLDNNTEGLLLITNDGTLMNGLLHPRFEVEKTYHAGVTGQLTEEKLQMLRDGTAARGWYDGSSEGQPASRARARRARARPHARGHHDTRGAQPPGPPHVRGCRL